MSILIENMEMPKDGETVTLTICADGLTFEEFKEPGDVFHAVPVPPHGRLIDADAFIAEQRHLYCENCGRRKGMKNGKMKFVYDIGDAPCRACGYGDVLDDIDDAPTILEAEEDE